MRATSIIASAALAVACGSLGCSGDNDKAAKGKGHPGVEAGAEKKPEVKEEHKKAEGPEPGYVGIKHQTIDKVMAKKIGHAGGTQVVDVSSDGPAAKAGMKNGDVIVSFNGKAILSGEELDALVEKTPAGKKVAVVVMRGKAKKTLTVTSQPRS